MSTHLVIPDQHAHPDFSNERAEWLGQLIKDLRPEVVINIGDAADMASLSSYDRGTRGFMSRSYERDINSHLDFQERMWEPMKRAKKKRPRRIVIEGNHENRIKRAIESDPQLEGSRFGISFRDLDFDRYYDTVVEYEGQTPGIIAVDGVHYSHFFVSGVMGRPIGGEHHAYSLITKNFTSCTCGHSHTVDWAVRTDTTGRKIMGCVAGVYQDYRSDWAGHAQDLWWSGVLIKRGVSDGVYSPQFVSIADLRREYGS